MNARVNFGSLERLLDWLKSLSDHQKYFCEKHESQGSSNEGTSSKSNYEQKCFPPNGYALCFSSQDHEASLI